MSSLRNVRMQLQVSVWFAVGQGSIKVGHSVSLTTITRAMDAHMDITAPQVVVVIQMHLPDAWQVAGGTVRPEPSHRWLHVPGPRLASARPNLPR